MTVRPAILLDRDGTIIVERDYLSDPTLVELERGVVDGLTRLQRAGWPLVVLTNQSGIGRGLFPRAAADAVNARTADLLRAEGITVLGWYMCPHAPDKGCDCRKPAPGMARQAARDLNLDLAGSWMIGDKPADLALGNAIGARSILLRTGHGRTHAPAARDAGETVCDDLSAAADHILTGPHSKAAAPPLVGSIAS